MDIMKDKSMQVAIENDEGWIYFSLYKGLLICEKDQTELITNLN